MSIMDGYSTAAPLMPASALPAWIGNDTEKRRIASYQLYEQIYWNVPLTFALYETGDNTNPLYIPSGKRIVETMHRNLAPKPHVVPVMGLGTTQQIQDGLSQLNALFARERFMSQFSMNKRFGLIRGDWLWHIYANPLLPEGSRITIEQVDPARWFPIFNPLNVSEVIGVHLVDYFLNNEDKPRIRRLTYRKTTMQGGPSPITVEDAIFEIDKWGGPGMGEEGAPDEVVIPLTTLPPQITSLPVYVIPNFQDGSPYGASEMRGIERLIAGINQTASDEDIALALESLGVYWSDGGHPIDPDTQQEVPWNIGPGRVIEVANGATFDRVKGIDSITPFQDHIKFMADAIDQAVGTPAVAQGRVDVTVAESGIALYLQMQPLLARAEEKEQSIIDVHNNFLWDIRAWFQAYEPALAGGMDVIQWTMQFGDHLPTNNTQRFTEIMAMVAAKLVSMAWAREELTKIGYEFPDNDSINAEIIQEQTALAQIDQDATGARVQSELDTLDPNAGGE